MVLNCHLNDIISKLAHIKMQKQSVTGFESVSSFHIPLVSSHIACSALHKMGVCLTADEV